VAASLWAVAIYLVPQVVVGLLLSIYPALKGWDSAQANAWLTNSAAAQFVYTVLVEAMVIWFVLLLLRYYKTAKSAIGLVRARLQDIWYAAAGFVVYFVAFLVLVEVAHVLIPGLNVNQQQNVGFQQATTGISLAMAFASLVLLPPIAEEIIFRGFVYTGFRRKFGFVIATLGTSVLFAAPHLLEATSGGPLWVAGIDTFILSFVLCFLREKTGRLWAGMGVHALKNGVAFATLFIFHVH
jgi:hypothetical protein